MKKKIMSIISLVAIVMAIGYNIYSSQKRYVVLSDLVLANVEALAQDENPPKLYSAVKGTLSSNVFRSVEQPKTIRNIQT